MQAKLTTVFLIILALAGAPTVHAEEATVVEIGHTGLSLPNQAVAQDKHYVDSDRALMERVAQVLADMDCLLAALHALPPELQGTAVSQPVQLDELAGLVELALNNNPELQPLRSRLAQQAAMTLMAGAKPDPMVSFKLNALPIPQFELGDTPMTQIVFGWSQKYIGYGKRGLRREIAHLDEDLTTLDLSARELELIGGISSLYFQLAATRAQLAVIDDHKALLELLLELAERKYALGRTPQALVISGQVKLTKLDERLVMLRNMQLKQEEMLRGLTGHAEGFDPAQLKLELAYALPQEVILDEEQLLHDAVQLHPMYQRFKVAGNQAELEIELAKRGYHPDFTVSAGYGLRWGKRDFITAGISIPVFTHKAERQDAKLQASYAMLDMVAASREQFDNMLLTKIGTISIDLTRLTELSALYRDALIPQARLALDSNIAGYAANQVDFAQLLTTEQALLTYELELEQLAIDYLATLAELQVATAGAFDPSPYLAASLAGLGTTAELALDIDALVVDEELAEVRSLLLPPEAEDFIPQLHLPESTGHPVLGPEPTGEAEPATEDVGDPEDDANDTEAGAGFFEPFVPSQADDKDEE